MSTDSTQKYGTFQKIRNVLFRGSSVEPLVESTDESGQQPVEKITLKREIGLFAGISMSVSTIVGTGIFIFAADVLRQCGSAYASLIIWAVGGAIAAICALCLAEIGTVITATGGWYSYILVGLGRGFAFLIMWVSVAVSYPCTLAIMSMSFSQYLILPFYEDCNPPIVAVKLIAATTLMVIAAISIMEVKVVARLQIFFTIAKVLPLAVIPITGIVMICLGRYETSNLEPDFDQMAKKPSDIALAFYAGVWSYSGWDCLCFGRSELKKPERNLPLALGISVTFVTVIYVFVQFGYMIILSPAQMMSSSAIALDWAAAVAGQAGKFAMSFCVALAILGSMAGSTFTSSKLCYAAAVEGQLIKLFSMIHVEKRTPIPPIILNTILSIIYLIPSDVASLLNIFGFVGWLTVLLSLLAVIILRYSKDYKDRPRYFKMPIVITFLAAAVSAYFIIGPIISDPQISLIYGVTLALAGVFFIYMPIFWMKIVPVGDFAPAINWVTRNAQLVLNVVKPDVEQ